MYVLEPILETYLLKVFFHSKSSMGLHLSGEGSAVSLVGGKCV